MDSADTINVETAAMSTKETFPYVSVVIPVFNGQKSTRICLESVLAQDYPLDCYEVIVVDNNSTDETPRIVQEYPVLMLQEKEIQTSYAARNRGIQNSRGEIVAFIDATCVSGRNWLSELVKSFNDPKVAASGGAVKGYPPTTLVERYIHSTHMYEDYQDREQEFLPILLTGNLAVRRTILLELGGFRANLFTIGDIDLGWRIQLQTKQKVICTRDAIVYHVHRSTLWTMFKQQRRLGCGRILLHVMYKRYPSYPRTLSVEIKTIVRQTLSLTIYIRSLIYRLLTYYLRNKDWFYAIYPFFCFVAESGCVLGKLEGLWMTRFLRRDPSVMLLEDPRGQ